jgi:hypothetical protein
MATAIFSIISEVRLNGPDNIQTKEEEQNPPWQQRNDAKKRAQMFCSLNNPEKQAKVSKSKSVQCRTHRIKHSFFTHLFYLNLK